MQTAAQPRRPSARAPWNLRAVMLCLALAALLAPSPAPAFEDADVRAIVGNVKQPSDYPGSGGIWMARERVVKLDGMGNAVIVEHSLARVFDPKWGRARFSPYERTYSSIQTSLVVERARIWRSRDESIDLPREAASESLAAEARGVSCYAFLRTSRVRFPELRSGDVVELRLAWTIRTPRDEYNTRWLMETFGAEEPVVEQQLSIIDPRALQTWTGITGPAVPKRLSDLQEGHGAHWLTGNLPGLARPVLETDWSRIPAGEDSISASVSRLYFTTASNWTVLSDRFGPFWEEAWERHSRDLDRLTAKATAAATDLGERARYLERYVRDEVTTLPIPDAVLGLRPLDATEILRAGAGAPRDKACLLVSLLRQSGVQATPVLVRTRSAEWDSTIACPDQLDRYLVRARVLGRGELWLDPVRTAGETHESPPNVGLIFPGAREGREQGGESGLVAFPGLRAVQ